jgi:hypothetical protein
VSNGCAARWAQPDRRSGSSQARRVFTTCVRPKHRSTKRATSNISFDDLESSDDSSDSDDDSGDPRKPKKPARQRVELRNEQQSLRRQLSDWDDYGQDDFDTKL